MGSWGEAVHEKLKKCTKPDPTLRIYKSLHLLGRRLFFSGRVDYESPHRCSYNNCHELTGSPGCAWVESFLWSVIHNPSKMNTLVTSPQEKPCNNDGKENQDSLIHPASTHRKMCATNTSFHRQPIYSYSVWPRKFFPHILYAWLILLTKLVSLPSWNSFPGKKLELRS